MSVDWSPASLSPPRHGKTEIYRLLARIAELEAELSKAHAERKELERTLVRQDERFERSGPPRNESGRLRFGHSVSRLDLREDRMSPATRARVTLDTVMRFLTGTFINENWMSLDTEWSPYGLGIQFEVGVWRPLHCRKAPVLDQLADIFAEVSR